MQFFFKQLSAPQRIIKFSRKSEARYKIAEELGQSHEESSFFKALHDGTVKGTCMILDEKVQHNDLQWAVSHGRL